MRSKSIKSTVLLGLIYSLALNGFLYIGQLSIARSLSREDYALFIVATNFVALASLLVDLGLTSLTVKLFAEANIHQSTSGTNPLGRLLGTVLFLRGVMSLIVVGLVILCAPLLGYNNDAILLMSIFLASLFISNRLFALRAAGEAYMRGTGHYHKYILYATLDAAFFAFGILAIQIYKNDVFTLMTVYTVANLPGCLLLVRALNHDLKRRNIHLALDFGIVKTLFSNGIPLIIGSICLAIHNAADPLILDKLSTPIDVSAFGVSLRIQSALMFLPLVFSSIIAPEITRFLGVNKIEAASELVHKGAKILLIFSSALALAVTTLPHVVIRILLGGNKYSDITMIITLLAWAFVGIAYSLFIIEIAVAEGKQWISMIFMIVSMVASLSLDLILIPRYGAYGAAWARFIAIAIASITVWMLTWKMVTIHKKNHRHYELRFALSLGVSIGVHFLSQLYGAHELVDGALTLSTFCTLIYVTKLVQVNDMKFLNPYRQFE